MTWSSRFFAAVNCSSTSWSIELWKASLWSYQRRRRKRNFLANVVNPCFGWHRFVPFCSAISASCLASSQKIFLASSIKIWLFFFRFSIISRKKGNCLFLSHFQKKKKQPVSLSFPEKKGNWTDNKLLIISFGFTCVIVGMSSCFQSYLSAHHPNLFRQVKLEGNDGEILRVMVDAESCLYR